MKVNDIPLVEGVRYHIDFQAMPRMIFAENSNAFLKAIIESDGKILADLFNEMYHSFVTDKKVLKKLTLQKTF